MKRSLLTLVTLLCAGRAAAQGNFQVRYFLPSETFWNGLSAELNWRGDILGGQLDAHASLSGPEQRSFSATYSHERTVVLAQYDGQQTLYGSGRKTDATALLFAQQGFEVEESGLKQVSLTALYTASETPAYTYSVLSGDLNIVGQFSRQWSWTAGAGITSSDTGVSSDHTSGNLSERLKAGITWRSDTEQPTTVTVQTSWNQSQADTLDAAGTKTAQPPSRQLGVTANATGALSTFETLSGSAHYENSGTYGSDMNLTSTRLTDWALSSGVSVNGRLDSSDSAGNTISGMPVTPSWSASIMHAPQPWGIRLTYAGTGGTSPSEQLDGEVQYQQGTLGVQVGGGATFQPSNPSEAPSWQTAYRASLGLSFQAVSSPPPNSGDPPDSPSESFQTQFRLNGSATSQLSPTGTTDYQYGASISGNINYIRGPFSFQVSSSLNYSGFNIDQPWSGELGIQGLYKINDSLQLNASARYRPATQSSAQIGFGLRYSF